MKVLLATDGSPSAAVADELAVAIDWPPATEIAVLTVVPEYTWMSIGPAPALGAIETGDVAATLARERSSASSQETAAAVAGPGRSVTTDRPDGPAGHRHLPRGGAARRRPRHRGQPRDRRRGVAAPRIGVIGSRRPGRPRRCSWSERRASTASSSPSTARARDACRRACSRRGRSSATRRSGC